VPLNQPMYSTMARRASALVGQGWRSSSSPLIEEKNDSDRALSQHWPLRPAGRVTWQSLASSAKAAEVYWAAPVGVEDHTGAWVAGGDRVSQCVSNQLGAQVISDGKAHDAA
jgi:hypothetical protein